MQENERIAPAANTNARSIPTDDVVEKLGFMVFVAFYVVAFYMYVGRVRPDATFFIFRGNVLSADESKSYATWVQRLSYACTDEVRLRKFRSCPGASGNLGSWM